MGGGSGALKFWKWVLAAFYQKLPTPKKRFYKSCHKMFLCSGEHNYLSFEIDAKQNVIQNWWFPRFQVMTGRTEMFLVLKITKDSKLFHRVRIWSKKWWRVCHGTGYSSYCLTEEESWWKLMTAYFQPSTKFLADLSIVEPYCSEKADILGTAV